MHKGSLGNLIRMLCFHYGQFCFQELVTSRIPCFNSTIGVTKDNLASPAQSMRPHAELWISRVASGRQMQLEEKLIVRSVRAFKLDWWKIRCQEEMSSTENSWFKGESSLQRYVVGFCLIQKQLWFVRQWLTSPRRHSAMIHHNHLLLNFSFH